MKPNKKVSIALVAALAFGGTNVALANKGNSTTNSDTKPKIEELYKNGETQKEELDRVRRENRFARKHAKRKMEEEEENKRLKAQLDEMKAKKAQQEGNTIETVTSIPETVNATPQPVYNIIQWQSIRDYFVSDPGEELREYMPQWYVAHWYTEYGKVIANLNIGDRIIIDGNEIEVKDIQEFPKGAFLSEVLFNNGEKLWGNPILQTCIEGTKNVRFVIGKYSPQLEQERKYVYGQQHVNNIKAWEGCPDKPDNEISAYVSDDGSVKITGVFNGEDCVFFLGGDGSYSEIRTPIYTQNEYCEEHEL